ncbi:MAG: efflux transporter periplasmic adaptor subunit [Gammaproteobacteria bacterium]|nr:MAG: efflux transporter periplasmic adaptor subunit [Gammaproteobacteria bacterium]
MKNRFNPASSRNALILLALFSAFAASAETPVAKTAPLATATGSPAPQGIRALLIAPTETVLSSQMDGRILSIPVKDGDTAKKGDVLLEFDCKENKAELRKSRAQLSEARYTWKANQQLKKERAVRELDVQLSSARLEQARADYEIKKSQTAKCKIAAPFDGRVVKVLVKPFQSVSSGVQLVEFLDNSKLEIQLYAPSRWLTWIKPGLEFDIQVDETGKTYPAVVTGIGARVDPVSQTVEIKAEINGEYGDLLAGMSGVALLEEPK